MKTPARPAAAVATSALAADPDALRGASADARPRLVVFLPGLVETADARGATTPPATTVIPHVICGTLLERDLGRSSVWVRHNSGLRISDNRRKLTGLLGERWKIPVASG